MGSGKQPTLISRMLDFVMSHTGYYHVLREKPYAQNWPDALSIKAFFFYLSSFDIGTV